MGRPVCFLGFVFPPLAGAGVAAPICAPDRIDDRVRIAHVTDGDTVRLEDGRLLRLIGFDAAELGREGAVNQPFSIAARDRLRSLIFVNDQTLALRFDEERHDRHGRLLAHGFLQDGTSVSAVMLQTGLAAHMVIPPNVWNQTCYAAEEQLARAVGRGLWSLDDYKPVASAELKAGSPRRFRLVTGRVSLVREQLHTISVHLEGPVVLYINRDDLRYFDMPISNALIGSQVEAHGWLYPQRGELRMQIRHSAALRMLASSAVKEKVL